MNLEWVFRGCGSITIPLANYMAVNYMLIVNRMLYLANCTSLGSESFEFSTYLQFTISKAKFPMTLSHSLSHC